MLAVQADTRAQGECGPARSLCPIGAVVRRGDDDGDKGNDEFPRRDGVQVSTGDSWASTIARRLYHGEDAKVSLSAGLFFSSYQLVVGCVLMNIVVAVLLDEFLMAMTKIRSEEDETSAFVRATELDAHPLDPLLDVLSVTRTPQDLEDSLRGLFDRLDVDCSGALNYHEVQQGLERLPVFKLSGLRFSLEDWEDILSGLASDCERVDAESFCRIMQQQLTLYIFRRLHRTQLTGHRREETTLLALKWLVAEMSLLPPPAPSPPHPPPPPSLPAGQDECPTEAPGPGPASGRAAAAAAAAAADCTMAAARGAGAGAGADERRGDEASSAQRTSGDATRQPEDALDAVQVRLDLEELHAKMDLVLDVLGVAFQGAPPARGGDERAEGHEGGGAGGGGASVAAAPLSPVARGGAGQGADGNERRRMAAAAGGGWHEDDGCRRLAESVGARAPLGIQLATQFAAVDPGASADKVTATAATGRPLRRLIEIVGVQPYSRAWSAGLEEGDVLESIDGEALSSLEVHQVD